MLLYRERIYLPTVNFNESTQKHKMYMSSCYQKMPVSSNRKVKGLAICVTELSRSFYVDCAPSQKLWLIPCFSCCCDGGSSTLKGVNSLISFFLRNYVFTFFQLVTRTKHINKYKINDLLNKKKPSIITTMSLQFPEGRKTFEFMKENSFPISHNNGQISFSSGGDLQWRQQWRFYPEIFPMHPALLQRMSTAAVVRQWHSSVRRFRTLWSP